MSKYLNHRCKIVLHLPTIETTSMLYTTNFKHPYNFIFIVVVGV